MKELIYNNRKIIYKIQQSRGRNVRITVRPDGCVALFIPARISIKRATQFLEQKAGWIVSSLERFKKNPPVPAMQPMSRKDFEKHKEKAALLARERVCYFNAQYGFQFKNISIKNQKTRWGSCSSKRNLNFNARIAFLPAHLADYIIVHELCHLKELNHSPAFWQLVARVVPDHRARRKELRNAAGARLA